MSQKHFIVIKKSRSRQKLKLIPAGVRKLYQTLLGRKKIDKTVKAATGLKLKVNVPFVLDSSLFKDI